MLGFLYESLVIRDPRVYEAAENLLRFAERIDTKKSGPPQTLGVIVATGMGYRRPDGVAVLPIGALAP